MVEHRNGKTYDNAYLITFKAGPLRTHTHTHTLPPSILPLLEAPTEGFVWNLPEFGCRIRFDAENITITHRATHCLLCSNSSPRKAFLSLPNHRTPQISLQVTLAVPYSENGPQGDPFCNHGGHQIKCVGRTLEDSKRSLPLMLPTMAGSMEQVCVCA